MEDDEPNPRRARAPRTRTVHALLVGIDEYRPSVAAHPLRGCLNDIAAARTWLESRIDGPLSLRVLRNGEATAAAVREGMTEHLGRAAAGDSALFWFSGHGTRFAARSAEELMKEGTGDCQAIVCADGPLADVELGPLLESVAGRGAHTTAVMDCCFSGGTTREDGDGPTARFLPPAPGWRPPEPSARALAAAAGALPYGGGYVTLAAGTVEQLVYEHDLGGRRHGMFSYALLEALAAAGPTATSREILSAAHCRVQILRHGQDPVLLPHESGGLADRPFLGGAARAPSPQLLRHGRDGWEVDHGSLHGLSAWADGRPADQDAASFVVTSGGVAAEGPDSGTRVVRVREVRPDRTLVTPADWAPDPARVYPVALATLALPPARLLVDAPHDPGAEEWLLSALATAGPGGGPTPLLRVGPGPDHRHPEPLIRFHVVVRGGRAQVTHRDGGVVVPGLPLADRADAYAVVDSLIHLTRWYQLHGLRNPRSPLEGRVQVEVCGLDGTPVGAGPAPYGTAEQVFRYGGGPGDWHEPLVQIRIHNRSRLPLWCVLLDLTDSHGASLGLYEPDFIGAGRTGYALRGDPVRLSLPPGRMVRPGAYVRDWLKLIVAENEFNTVPFQLEPLIPGAARNRLDPAADGVLRLAAPARTHRDAGPARPPWAGEWSTRTVALRTVVPTASGR
ncbi:caspase family protein [Streptomyces rubiginosohelvolus]|uniref:caspase family protein n=1 Tax=Streptomyces rubiginosohelvolus TaxID=67362 RepID=UPI0035DD400D